MKRLIVLVSFCFILCGCSKSITEYDTKMVCVNRLNDSIEESGSSSLSKIYIDYDDVGVTKAIYQSIAPLDAYDSTLLDTLDNIVINYNRMAGIRAKKYIIDEQVILEIEYNYLEIDVLKFREYMGSLLNEESLLSVADTFPVNLDKFKKIELVGYDCEEKK